MEKLVVNHFLAPGDTLVLSAFLRDLQLAHPGRFRVLANVHGFDLLRHNPHVFAAYKWGPEKQWGPSFQVYNACYGRGLVAQKDEVVHFLAWQHREFEQEMGLHVPLTAPVPEIHFAPAEAPPLVTGRYWVVVAGGKSDVPIKIWSTAGFQRVVDMLREQGIHVVQVGAIAKGHRHPKLERVLDLVGRTGLRGLARIIRDAEGVVCGVTLCMHMAAALGKPCVVLAGGREAWWWTAYDRRNIGLGPHRGELPVSHHYLHTIGLLPCCHRYGCWRNSVVPPDRRGRVCYRPTRVQGQDLARCMAMITPEHVVKGILSYYKDQTLPPVEAGGEEPALKIDQGRVIHHDARAAVGC